MPTSMSRWPVAGTFLRRLRTSCAFRLATAVSPCSQAASASRRRAWASLTCSLLDALASAACASLSCGHESAARPTEGEPRMIAARPILGEKPEDLREPRAVDLSGLAYHLRRDERV